MSGGAGASPIDLLKHYRAEIRFESDLAGQRINALLGSQSFLVIAYSSSMGASNGRWAEPLALALPAALALLGLILALLAWPGIRAAQAVVEQWRAREAELLVREVQLAPFSLGADEEGRGTISRRRREGALFARRAPAVFVCAWCVFLGLPFLFHVAR